MNIRTINSLRSLGIARADALALRRISMTLQRWSEHECNGVIQRSDSGIPYWHSSAAHQRVSRTPDRESGALKRLDKIMARYPTLRSYRQPDPRGVALYIIRPSDVPAGRAEAEWYSNGVAVVP